jgi:putative drug exporter of the RND superfamily
VFKLVGDNTSNDLRLPGTDGQKATDLLTKKFPPQQNGSSPVVFYAKSSKVTSKQNKQAIVTSYKAIKKLPHVYSATSPFSQAGEKSEISKDKHTAFISVILSVGSADLTDEIANSVLDAAAPGKAAGMQVAVGGPIGSELSEPHTESSEIIGLVAAMIILAFTFGTFVAMGMPILSAIAGLICGLAIIMVFGHVATVPTIVPTLATMIGLGVGIDYALFIVTRFRQALHDGLEPREAAAAATATAGRAVIFAGLTVAISISALAVIGLDFITKLGFGAAITVVTAVAAAVTLLPAVLSLLGHRIDRAKVPFVPEPNDSYEARQRSLAARWGGFVTRNARVVTVACVLGLVTLALPTLGWVNLGSSDAGSNPTSSTTRRAYDLLAEGFGPGFNGPLLVSVDQRRTPEAAGRLAAAIRDEPGVASVTAPVTNAAKDTAQLVVYPTSAPDSDHTKELVDRLRDETVPSALAGTGATAYVGGATATFEDIASRILGRFPLFLLVTVGITFLILSMAFRSVVIALKASLTTLLSALAAFGILVAVFQFGWGGGLIGLDSTGPIESFLPVIVFSILFGLSMDYEVFLVSRIREEYVHGDEPRPAIVDGMGAIGRVVMAAAAIMAVVFFSFVLGPDRAIKEFGIALGAAILIDAFIVRLTLVPAVMWLLDRQAWYMPAWLDRILPRLTIEPPVSEPPAPERPMRPVPAGASAGGD